MNFKEMAPKIVEYIGGKENVSAHTHCMTRLRFVLKDDSKVNEEELKKMFLYSYNITNLIYYWLPFAKFGTKICISTKK